MLYATTLNEIENNINTGVEYEIALFAKLIASNQGEYQNVVSSIQRRPDRAKIAFIMAHTNVSTIINTLHARGLTYRDASFETQNDSVGPADIVMIAEDVNGGTQNIGLSVKYANTCTLNVTGRNFLTDAQITTLKSQLPLYTKQFIDEMNQKHGRVSNWFRKRKSSDTTDAYIDLIRDAVIDNWPNIQDKVSLLSDLFHADSPIEFWVVTYSNNGYTLKTKPQTIDMRRANDVTVGKYQTSFVAFYLDGNMVGHMQVKFNNGFVEKCKKQVPDVVEQGIRMSYGQPFSSWNFYVEK